jgi:integrase
LLNLPYLVVTKTGAHRYRRRVPDNLRAELGRIEIVRSLRTGDRKLVPHRYAQVHAAVERLFTEARRKAGISEDVAFDMAVATLRALGLDGLTDREDRSTAADIVLARAGLSDPEELSEALEGYPAGKAPVKLKALSTALGILAGAKRRPTLSHCLRQFLTDKERGQDLSKKVWLNYERERKRIVASFVKFVGDKNITEVTRQDARGFVSKLEEEGYSPASVKKQASFLSALTSWALKELELEGVNPFLRLKVATPVGHKRGRLSFRYDEVQTMLTKVGTVNTDLQDIVRLLASTGARLGEICGLQVGDVDLDANTIHIRFNDLRRLKNTESIRLLPVVDEVSMKALRLKVEGKPRSASVFKRYGRDIGADAASQAIGKWLTKIGLRDPAADKPKTIHSMRHCFNPAFALAGNELDQPPRCKRITVHSICSARRLV